MTPQPQPFRSAAARSDATKLRITKSFQCTPTIARELEEAAAREGVAQQQIVQRALSHELSRLNRTAWGTVDNDDHYDPKQIYARGYGTDNKGHSAEIRVRIPTTLRGEMQELIESGAIPEYGTVSHIARDALFHRVKMVGRWLDAGELEQQADIAMLMSQEQKLREQEAEAVGLIEAVGLNLASLWKHAQQTEEYARFEEYLADRAGKAGLVPEAHRLEYERVLGEYRNRLKRVKGNGGKGDR